MLSSEPIYTSPLEPIAGDEYQMPPLVEYLHFNVPSGLMAYNFLPDDPAYMTPSPSTATDPNKYPFVVWLHKVLPDSISIAYTFLSNPPIYTVLPSKEIAGEEYILFPTTVCQYKVPNSLSRHVRFPPKSPKIRRPLLSITAEEYISFVVV